MLTYDPDPLIPQLYPDRTIREFDLSYSAHRTGTAPDYLIASDSIHPLIPVHTPFR